jgi:lipid II:glycine glycyltransferase (peptidoglycan interpeptide bridge formation enzyme)
MEPFVFGLQQSAISHQTLRAVCVGYVTKEKNPIKQYFTRRAIINGGPVIADDATCEEVKFLMEAVRQRLQILDFRFKILNSPIYIETRNFNDYSMWREAFERAGFGYKKHLNFHIDCTDKEAMWERLSEVRRRQVKKAISNGVEIKSEGISEAEIREWYQILKDLYAKKVKTPLFPLEFFLSFYRKDIGKYLLVKYRGKVIGGMICPIMDGRTIYEWYICGLDNEYREQYPSVMATWAAMEYANEHGLARFDVMGAGVPGVPYGVRDFKAEFGGELVEQGRFLCVCKPWLYRLGTFVVKLMKRKKHIKPF